MELGSWSGCERVLRYAHSAIDHLRDAAGRIDGTFTPHRARPRLARVEQAIDSDGGQGRNRTADTGIFRPLDWCFLTFATVRN